MRLIGRLENEKLARRFGDYLTASQISNLVEPGSEGGWLIWIEDEEQLDPASEALARFQADPESPEFQRKREAARVRAINEREQEAYRKRQIDVRREWQRRASADAIPVTIAMILISIGVAVASAWGTDDRVLRPLRIADFFIDYDRVFYYPLIDLFAKGQVWRPVTPIFIHHGILHLVFNMYWLLMFGRMIEPRRRSMYFVLLVLATAVPSNLLQYCFAGPNFGGMSGVVYGLFGYIWMRNRFSYRDEYPMDPRTITFFMIWFVLCLSGLVGPVANWAHGGGLAVGALWGFLSSDRFRRILHSNRS